MAQFLNETFTGADDTRLQIYNPLWGTSFGTVQAELFTNRCKLETTGSARYLYDTPAATADVDAQFTYNGNSTTALFGIILRAQDSTNYYLGRYSNGSAQIYKFVNNTATLLNSATVTLPINTDVPLRFEAVGTTLNLYFNGDISPTVAATDSEFPAAGKVGFRLDTGAAYIDNFTADDQSAGGVVPQGTVTIGSITHDHNSATVSFTYSDTDQTGFEYRLNGGVATAVPSSPISLSALTPEMPYDVEVRAVNASGAGAWSAVSSFTTDAAPVSGGTIANATPCQTRTGQTYANATFDAWILNEATDSLVLNTQITTNSTGNFSITDNLLVAGTTYLVVGVDTTDNTQIAVQRITAS